MSDWGDQPSTSHWGANELGSPLGAHDTSEGQNVVYRLATSGADSALVVTSLDMQERVGGLYEAVVWVRAPLDAHLDEDELLGKDVALTIERGVEQRSVRGIVRSASVRDAHDGQHVCLEIVPGLWLVSHIVDSRIYQNISVPKLIEEIVGELLGGRQRTVRHELTEEYEEHEYLVQHRESHMDFIARLCDAEGIFFYFDHDADGEDHEVLVLADSNDNRPLIHGADGGRVHYTAHENHALGLSVATDVSRRTEVGATDAVVSGFDWSNPDLGVKAEQKGRGAGPGPALETYDHDRAVRHHRYDDGGGQYQTHTASRQARIKAERHDLSRHRWTVESTVVTAKPGYVFELVGTDRYDGRYLIVGVVGHGSAGPKSGGYFSTMTVVPETMPFRPAAPVRRLMAGPETAIVVGPAGEEIHTDQHGRVKVQFHWDRRGQRNEHSSAWIRVAQGWAGPGWGMMFIPRIGMEVIVSFLGGDPDCPVVTGCLYNGKHRPPYSLPKSKTRSTIKTNSSLGGSGYNELRFEDLKGEEEVFLHAQKDLNELVEHNHSTRVKNCQANTVDVHQVETIGRNQTMHVKGTRKKTVDEDEHSTIVGMREELVRKDEFVEIELNRNHKVDVDDTLTVLGTRTVMVAKGQRTEIEGDRKSRVTKNDRLSVSDMYDIDIGTHIDIVCASARTYMSTTQFFAQAPTSVQIQNNDTLGLLALQSGGQTQLKGMTQVVIESGASKITLTPGGVNIEGPRVTINGQTLVEIQSGGQVKIKEG